MLFSDGDSRGEFACGSGQEDEEGTPEAGMEEMDEEADEEDYERIKNILSDSESEKRRWRGKGYKSLSSFEDEEYWDAEDVSAGTGPIQYSIPDPDRNKAFWVNQKLLPSLSLPGYYTR